MDYGPEHVAEREITDTLQTCPYRDTPEITWVHVRGIHRQEVVGSLGECFGIHHLLQEDILAADQRPKVEEKGDYLFVVMRLFGRGEAPGSVTSEQVTVVVGRGWVLSFQETGWDFFEPLRREIRSNGGGIRERGAGYLAYRLMDLVVDQYFTVLEGIGEVIEELEERVVVTPDPSLVRDLHTLKRSLLEIRRVIWPMRGLVGRLLHQGPGALFGEGMGVYFNDLQDHVLQIMDTAEVYRDMLSGILDIYLSSVSNRMNEIMKVLTVIATIFIPLTFLAGLYGMNFRHMPELEWVWGYPLVLLIMLSTALGMLAYFKRKRWF
jgi:magnesium transporter